MNTQIVLNLAECVTILLLMMVPGFILKKSNLVSAAFGKDISNLILYIAQPILVLSAYICRYDIRVAKRAGVVFLLAILAHLVFFAIAFLFFKRSEGSQKTVLRFAVIFSNAGYMGIPLIRFTLGEKAVIYASVYLVVFNVFLWTLGYFMYSGDRRYMSLRNALLNPTSIATYIGLIIFFFNLQAYLPADGIVIKSLTMLKDLVAPLSMFIIGFRLTDAFKSKHMIDRNMCLCIFLRLIAAPSAVFAVLLILYKTGICTDYTAICVTFFASATPVAAVTSMLAEKFAGNAVYASMVVSISTVLSLLTMPLLSLFLYLL